MSNLHKDIEEEGKHTAKGFTNALRGTIPMRNEFDDQVFVPISHLPNCIGVADSSASPSIEDFATVYLLDGTLGDLDIASIAWQSGNTVRVTIGTAVPTLGVDDYIEIIGTTNPLHEGIFKVTNFNAPGKYFDYVNPNIVDATTNEGAAGVVRETHQDWDGCPQFSWVKYDEATDKWYYIRLLEGQRCFDQTSNITWIYYDDSLVQSTILDTPAYESRVYDSGNFSVTGGTFTPSSSDYYDRYKVINKTLFWELFLRGTGGTTPITIEIELPDNNINSNYRYLPMVLNVNGSESIEVIEIPDGSTTASIRLLNSASMANGDVIINFSIQIEVQ